MKPTQPLALLTFALATSVASADVLHVPSEYTTIQAAIDASVTGDTVLVADGLYTGDGNRNLDFNGRNIRLKSENGPAHCTIDAQGTPEDPQRAFLFENGETRHARVEGFTITGGATLPGAVADEFNGGAIRIRFSAPTIKDCVFFRNQSGCWGGAVYAGQDASPLIAGCTFKNNWSDDDGGGFFTWLAGDVLIVNSVFIDNAAAVLGGAIADFGGSNLEMHNLTIVGNEANFGAAGVESWSDSLMTNSIVWNNVGPAQLTGGVDVSFSVVENGYPGLSNLATDPGLGRDRLHLRRGSPCVNAGDPTASPFPWEHDIDGKRRVQGARIDIGAHEFPFSHPHETSEHP